MANLEKIIGKQILIRLTGDGFISTVRYAGLYSKSATWQTRSPAKVSKEVVEPALTQTEPDVFPDEN
jgi:hypothetical protein